MRFKVNPHFKNLGSDNSLKNKVYENIKSMIINGHLKPKERLLEEVLSKAMNVSRAPIREALNKLEKEGFVKIFPRKGAIVADIDIQDVEEIFEIREVLEILAIRKSFSKIPLTEIEDIIFKLKEIDKKENALALKEEQKSNFLFLDKRFHQLIRKYYRNDRVMQILDNLQEQMQWFRSVAFEEISVNQSIEEHLSILEAIKKGDGELAERKLYEHIERAKTSLLNSLISNDHLNSIHEKNKRKD